MAASLNNIVDVNVQVSNPTAISTKFNLGLIIGDSAALENTKFKIYSKATYATEMVTDGFATTDPEYKAATIYFSQNNAPSEVAIGAITDDNTAAQTFTYLRGLNANWYTFCFVNSAFSDADGSAVAALVEASEIPTMFICYSSDSKCIQDGTTNLCKTIHDGKYTRTFAFYSTDADIAPAMVGMISGLNTMLDNSAYTAAYKTLVGVDAMDLTDAQLITLTGYNGNTYCKFGNTYEFTYPCISGGDYHIDEIYFIDVAKYLIQNSTVAGLVSKRKVPQTEDGVATITSFVSSACDRINSIGLISGGIWKGDAIKGLSYGDAVQNGYYIQSDTIADQSQEDRAARKSPTIYVALLGSGAIEHVVISVYINR